MSDLGSGNWSETDASNNATPPNGFPEGMNPSDVNNSARANMGAIKRFWDRTNSVKTTTGTSTAYVLTYSVAAASYYDGEEHSLVVHVTFGAAPTLNINSIGAKNLRKFTAGAWANAAASDCLTGQPIRVRYNQADDKFDIVAMAVNVADYLTITSLAALASAVNEAAVTLASAATLNIGAAAGNYIIVTGTTAITAFDTIQAGTRRTLKFSGALTLTHNATSLILPGGLNYTTTAGDVFQFTSEGSGNWRCTGYALASGTAVVPGPAWAGTRQTVAAGPVTSAGLPNFLPSTNASLAITSQNVSSSAPFVAAAANGWSATTGQPVDRVGYSSSNLTWSGLTASRAAGTPNYLYVVVNADGTLTTGSTIRAPIYQWGGTPATTSGQFTFNISEMKGYLGNGTTAPQAYIVFVGEAATDGTGVISTVPYAYNGRYESAFTATLPAVGVTVSANHNIGVTPKVAQWIVECTTTDFGYAVGEQLINPGSDNNTIVQLNQPHCTTKVIARTSGNGSTGTSAPVVSTGAPNPLTAASWKYQFAAQRGW